MHAKQYIQVGLEVFLENGLSQLHDQRVGLITNPTGTDHRLHNTVDLLRADAHVQLQALFGPEHGIRGDVQAGVAVAGMVDSHTGLPMYSLYGETLHPTAEMLQNLDALIYDIQDIGVRYSTYIATLAYAQEAAAHAGLTFVVFDRPNPLSGCSLAGNMLETDMTSFVGAYPLPVQNGLTSGELALLMAAERGWPAPIVVPMRGWQRQFWFDELDIPWIQPTPNLPTLDSLTLYPGTCLFEGTNCSEGRGTTRPFELIGAPGLNPFTLVKALEQYNIPGVTFRPTYFTPTFSKYASQLCGGVQVHILDRSLLRPVETGLYLLHAIRKLLPDTFDWIKKDDGTPFIDLLLGSSAPRQQLEAGADVTAITAEWQQHLADFQERRRPFLLYDEE